MSRELASPVSAMCGLLRRDLDLVLFDEAQLRRCDTRR